jgi:hypothetical protein
MDGAKWVDGSSVCTRSRELVAGCTIIAGLSVDCGLSIDELIEIRLLIR